MFNEIRDGIKSLVGRQPRFFLEIEGVPTTEIVSFDVEEKVSAPFIVYAKLASTTEISFGDVRGMEARLKITGDIADRLFHGVVRKFKHTGKSKSRKYLYRIEIVPYFELLSLEKDCRIFQDMKVQEIITTIFEESEIRPKFYEFRFANQDRLRKFCVQFNESDKEFIERLLQEEGIFYFYEHYKDRHVMVFGQDLSDYTPPKYDDEIKFMAPSGMNETEECIRKIGLSKKLTSGTYTHTNYNFKNPAADLERDRASKDEYSRMCEVYEYPGLYGEVDRGFQLAQSKLKSQQAFAEYINGHSNSNRLVPGHVFKLKGHDFKSFNKEYVVTEIGHHGRQDQTMEEEAEGGTSYFNDFFAIPSGVDYSPRKTIQKPLMRGPQTAMVVGREGDEICTDEYGRIKVQFHWDRKGQKDENSSCWVRCAQFWSGAGWGAQFTPRVGDEVIVDFLNGDPDFPVITGSLYNGINQPPHSLPANKTVSSIKTRSTPNSRGFNELRFDDKAGSEEIFIHAQKDCNIEILSDNKVSIRKNKIETIGESLKIVCGSSMLTMNKDGEIEISGTDLMIKTPAGKIHIDLGGIIDAKGALIKLNN